MKIFTAIVRVLLGLLFFVFGMNGFLQFINQPPPTGIALQFLSALLESREFAVIFGIQALGGALLLANRFVPLALILLAPIILNIVLFHFFMAPAGLPLALVAAAMWAIVFFSVRRVFAGLFQSKTLSESGSGPSDARDEVKA
jgi:putative oxidoreductase